MHPPPQEFIFKYKSETNDENLPTAEKETWPLEKPEGEDVLIVTCSTCHYPITLAKHVGFIEDEETLNDVALIIEFNKLHEKIIVTNNDFTNQWQTKIFCPNCGLLLSFPDFNEISGDTINEIKNYTKYFRTEYQMIFLKDGVVGIRPYSIAYERYQTINAD